MLLGINFSYRLLDYVPTNNFTTTSYTINYKYKIVYSDSLLKLYQNQEL